MVDSCTAYTQSAVRTFNKVLNHLLNRETRHLLFTEELSGCWHTNLRYYIPDPTSFQHTVRAIASLNPQKLLINATGTIFVRI